MSQITHDLAIVAKVSRTGLPTLEGTLAAFRRPPDEALKLSQIFVARVARIAAGAAVITVMLGLFAFLQIPAQHDSAAYEFFLARFSPFGGGDKVGGLLALTCVGATAYAIAAHVAARRFARRPVPARLDALARAATGVPTAAVLIVATFYGIMMVAIGGDEPYDLIISGIFPAVSNLLPNVSVLVLLAFAIAGLAAWRVRTLPPRPVVIGAAVIAATIAIGRAFDVGPLAQAFTGNWTEVDPALLAPSWLLRGALTVVGTSGLFLVVAGAFQAIRRREDA